MIHFWWILIHFWLFWLILDYLLVDFNPFWLKCWLKDQKWIIIHQKWWNQSKWRCFWPFWFNRFYFFIDFDHFWRIFLHFWWMFIHVWWILIHFAWIRTRFNQILNYELNMATKLYQTPIKIQFHYELIQLKNSSQFNRLSLAQNESFWWSLKKGN